MRSHRRGLVPIGLAIAGLAVMVLTAGSSSALSPEFHRSAPSNVVITDVYARSLGLPPKLTSGQRIIVAVSGFRAGAPVQAWLVGGKTLSPDLKANRFGTVRVVYRVPSDLSTGTHLLAFSGDGPVQHPARPTRDRPSGTIRATVPNIGLVHFSIGRSPHRHG